MQRWIIPASVVAILVSLAALVILLAASSSQPDVAVQQEEQIEQDRWTGWSARNLAPTDAGPGETEQAPDPGGLTQPEEDPAAQEEQPLGGGQTTQEDQPLGGGQTTQEDQTPGEDQPLGGGQNTQEDQQPGGATQEDQTTQQTPAAPGPSTATVRVTGDSAYYCSLGVIGEPETVQGQSPASYEVGVETGGTALDTVIAACQKISPGTLGVRILYDGEIVARDETDARLGTVSVSWNPLAEEL